MKCLLPLCLGETAGKPVEHNQQGQLLSIITPQPITVSGEAFPSSQQCQSYIVNYSGWIFLHLALGGQKKAQSSILQG